MQNKFISNTLTFVKKHKSLLIQYGCLVLVVLIFSIVTSGDLFSTYNLKNLVYQTTPLLIMAVGLIFIFAHGGFDVSCGAVCGLNALISILIINSTGSVLLALICNIIVSLLLYLFNIFISIKFKIMATISSLAIMFIARGIITYVCSLNNGTIRLVDYQVLSEIKNNVIIQIVACVIIVLIAILLFSYTKIGRQAKAIGDNPLSASQSGTKVNKIKFICYAFAGLCVGVAGIFVLARSGNVGKNIGSGNEMDVMVAIILGGMSLQGGSKTRLSSAIVGCITLKVLSTGMAIAGVPNSSVSLVKGILFIIIILTTLRQPKSVREMPR